MEIDKKKEFKNLSIQNVPSKKDQDLQNKIRSIIGYEDDIINKKDAANKLKIDYNKVIYFDQENKLTKENIDSEKQINKFISNVFDNSSNDNSNKNKNIKSNNNLPIFNEIQKGSNIKFNFNINNNFFNSNISNNDNKNIIEQEKNLGKYTEKNNYYTYDNSINNSNKNYNNFNIIDNSQRISYLNFYNNNLNINNSKSKYFSLYFLLFNFLLIFY
jgi:hypothetical protein